MLLTILVVAALAVLIAGTAALLTTRGRRRGVLEPPPAARSGERRGAVRRPVGGTPPGTRAPPSTRPRPGRPPSTPGRPAGPSTPPVTEPEAPAEPGTPGVPTQLVQPEVAPRFRDRLGKARAAFGARIGGIFSRGRIDEQAWEELEEALLLADVGLATTTKLLQALRERVSSREISTPDELLAALREDLRSVLSGGERSLAVTSDGTTVWLFVGVNGVGKTTTIGKVGLLEASEGRRVVMAAGDTFRAAAAEQLQQWADRVGADLVRGGEGGDPGAVVFDAVQRAASKGADLVLADTAGRLHNKVNLMEELKKVRRVADRPPGKVAEVLLVIDATTGQNGLAQARQFADAVGVTGVVLTKLDGSAKGGIAVAIESELGIPVKLVGLGEAASDLVPFDATEFVDALVAPPDGPSA
ncbi:MAG: signal recognition particle-docking protein FtsY [Actinomycetota bacterium]|nr:signal recognition particle-docking protein FtsY [Actinomycetota bacterium]